MSSINLVNSDNGGQPDLAGSLFQALLIRSAQGDYQAKALLDRLGRPQQGSDLPAMQPGAGDGTVASNDTLPPMRSSTTGRWGPPGNAATDLGDWFLTHDPLQGIGGAPADQAPPDSQPAAPSPPAGPPQPPDLPQMAGPGSGLIRMPQQPAAASGGEVFPSLAAGGGDIPRWLANGGLDQVFPSLRNMPPNPAAAGEAYQPPPANRVFYADGQGTYQPPSNVVVADPNGGPGATLPPMAGGAAPSTTADQSGDSGTPPIPAPSDAGAATAATPADATATPVSADVTAAAPVSTQAPLSPDGRPLPPMRRTAPIATPNRSAKRVVVTPAQAEATPAEQQQAPAAGSPPGAPVMAAAPSLAFATPDADREGGLQTGYIPPDQSQPPTPDNAPLPGMASSDQTPPATTPQLAAPASTPAPADDGRNTLFGMRMPSNQALRQLAILSGGISAAGMRPGTTALGAIAQGGAALAAHQDQQDLAKAKLGIESRKVDVDEKRALSEIQLHYDQLKQQSLDRNASIAERERAAADANATRQLMVQMQSQNGQDRIDAMRQWHAMMADNAASRNQTAAEAAADRRQATQDRNDRLAADQKQRADTAAAARDTANQRAQETANHNYDSARSGYLKTQTDPITGQVKPGGEDAADAYAAKAHPKAEASQAWYQSQVAQQSGLADRLKSAAQQKFGSDPARLQQEYDRIDKALGNTLDPLKRIFEK